MTIRATTPNNAGRVAIEWNTPTFGFAPKCASIAVEMSQLSLMSVGMLWVHRLLTAFHTWLRRVALASRQSRRSLRPSGLVPSCAAWPAASGTRPRHAAHSRAPLRGGASHEAEGRGGARDGRAGRAGAGRRRLCVVRQIRDEGGVNTSERVTIAGWPRVRS